MDYTSDDVHGFNAVVKKIGPSYHPGSVPHAPAVPAAYVAPAPAHGHGYSGPFSHGVLGGY